MQICSYVKPPVHGGVCQPQRRCAAGGAARPDQGDVAIANMLPTLTIKPNLGYTSTQLAQLITPQTLFWTLAGNATHTVFDGFSLFHTERAAEAALDQAVAQHRSTVITAFQNVADSLRAIQNDADALKAAVEFERAAKISLDLAQQQMQSGNANFLVLLTAQITYQQAILARVQAQVARLSDTGRVVPGAGRRLVESRRRSIRRDERSRPARQRRAGAAGAGQELMPGASGRFADSRASAQMSTRFPGQRSARFPASRAGSGVGDTRPGFDSRCRTASNAYRSSSSSPIRIAKSGPTTRSTQNSCREQSLPPYSWRMPDTP
jgi:hypothetical protein